MLIPSDINHIVSTDAFVCWWCCISLDSLCLNLIHGMFVWVIAIEFDKAYLSLRVFYFFVSECLTVLMIVWSFLDCGGFHSFHLSSSTQLLVSGDYFDCVHSLVCYGLSV